MAHAPVPRRKGLGLPGILALVVVVAVASGAGVWAVMSPSSSAADPSESAATPATPSPSGSPETAVPEDPQPSGSEGTAPEDLTARQAASLEEDVAAERLNDIRARDASVVAALPAGSWYPQLSSKCGPLTTADLGDNTGSEPFVVDRQGTAREYPRGFGYPDGSSESYPEGIGSPIVLAYHQAMRERFGPATVLVLPTDVGGSTTPAACKGEPIWVSLWTEESLPSAEAALAWCDEQLLPDGECAARLFAPNGESDVVLRTG